MSCKILIWSFVWKTLNSIPAKQVARLLQLMECQVCLRHSSMVKYSHVTPSHWEILESKQSHNIQLSGLNDTFFAAQNNLIVDGNLFIVKIFQSPPRVNPQIPCQLLFIACALMPGDPQTKRPAVQWNLLGLSYTQNAHISLSLTLWVDRLSPSLQCEQRCSHFCR